MSFTREQWVRDWLTRLGNRNPVQAVVDVGIGWTVRETFSGQGARFNLLNTTQHAPGSTTFNSVGVQNFVSYDQGVQTNADVLSEGFAGYAELKQAFVSNDVNALTGPSAGVQQGYNTWCGGCGYGAGFQALGSQHRGDIFTYGAAPASLALQGDGKMLIKHPTAPGRLDLLYINQNSVRHVVALDGRLEAAVSVQEAPGSPGTETLIPETLSAAWDDAGDLLTIVVAGTSGTYYVARVDAQGFSSLGWAPIASGVSVDVPAAPGGEPLAEKIDAALKAALSNL